MNQKERARFIQQILEECLPNPEIPLHHRDPFTLLVAVCLSAQCTDARVNTITPVLFKLAPTPQAMAELSPQDLAAIIQTCGLATSKAKRLVAMSKQILERHNGIVPSSFQELEALEGVGHKTASVIMAAAFGKPAFAVDTHILRCAKRWGLSKHKTVKGVEEDLKKLFPRKIWAKVHLQMILFARRYCPARSHEPSKCPICSVMQKPA